MSWTTDNYQSLKAWMDANADPGQSDHAVAGAYNAETRQGAAREIEARQFFEALEAGEVAQIQSQALDDKAKKHDEAAALAY